MDQPVDAGIQLPGPHVPTSHLPDARRPGRRDLVHADLRVGASDATVLKKLKAAQAAYAANLAWRAGWEAEHGRKLTGRKPTPPDPESLAKRRVNVTAPDTRMMKRGGGKSVQGYNVQVVASPHQIIVAAQVAQTVNDSNQLDPMVAHATAELVSAGIEEPLGVVLADGVTCSPPVLTG